MAKICSFKVKDTKMPTDEVQAKTQKQDVDSVDRRTDPSRKEFLNDYVKLSKPVILADAAKEWKAMKKLTPSFFKENYSNISKNINGVEYNMGDFIGMMLN